MEHTDDNLLSLLAEKCQQLNCHQAQFPLRMDRCSIDKCMILNMYEWENGLKTPFQFK